MRGWFWDPYGFFRDSVLAKYVPPFLVLFRVTHSFRAAGTSARSAKDVVLEGVSKLSAERIFFVGELLC